MCGRATLTNADINDLLRELNAEISGEEFSDEHGPLQRLWRPRYNIAPSDLHWVVESQAGHRVMVPAAWGYLASGRPLINVRGEQVASGGFRHAFQARRCVVVTDGFFEWDKRRTPFWYHRPDGGLVLLAGLYQSPPSSDPTAFIATRSPTRPATDPPRQSPPRQRFTVLTTRPNSVVAPVHNRMPVIIPPDRLDDWLTGEPAQASQLIAPAPDEALVATPVSRRVNSVKNDDAGCLTPAANDAAAPAEQLPKQGSLF